MLQLKVCCLHKMELFSLAPYVTMFSVLLLCHAVLCFVKQSLTQQVERNTDCKLAHLCGPSTLISKENVTVIILWSKLSRKLCVCVYNDGRSWGVPEKDNKCFLIETQWGETMQKKHSLWIGGAGSRPLDWPSSGVWWGGSSSLPNMPVRLLACTPWQIKPGR